MIYCGGMHVTNCAYVYVRVKASCRTGSLLSCRSRDQTQADCQAYGQAPLPRHVLALICLLRRGQFYSLSIWRSWDNESVSPHAGYLIDYRNLL